MEKYYRVYANVDIDAVEHNIEEIKKHLQPEAKIMAVIKADGYGHGAVPISKSLEALGVDQFAVAVIEEGIALRKNGCKLPILVLGFVPDNMLEKAIEYDIIPGVYRLDTAIKISAEAVKLGKSAKIHIKIDTGMNRLGFKMNDQSLVEIQQIVSLPFIEAEGVYTHFAKADETDRSFTNEQIHSFLSFVNKLEQCGVHFIYKHASNSAGMIDYKDYHFNIVRVGIVLYGLYPSDEVDHNSLVLHPVMTLKSHVVMLKTIEPGERVSYGGTFTATERRRIATIPLGYADGYARALSSKGRVIIRGQYAPIVGRVCMDYFMVDVSDIPLVQDGDEVIVIGSQDQATVTVDEIAKLTDTINYEVVCQFSKRIPRVYVRDGKIIDSIDYF